MLQGSAMPCGGFRHGAGGDERGALHGPGRVVRAPGPMPVGRFEEHVGTTKRVAPGIEMQQQLRAWFRRPYSHRPAAAADALGRGCHFLQVSVAASLLFSVSWLYLSDASRTHSWVLAFVISEE